MPSFPLLRPHTRPQDDSSKSRHISLSTLTRLRQPLRLLTRRRANKTGAITPPPAYVEKPHPPTAHPIFTPSAHPPHSIKALLHLPTVTRKLRKLNLHEPHLVTVENHELVPAALLPAGGAPPGYVLAGELKNVLNTGLAGKLYKLLPTAGKAEGVKEILILPGETPLSALLPGAPKNVKLREVRLVYGAKGKEGKGLYLHGTLATSWAPVEAEVEVSAFLSQVRDWKRPLDGARVVVEGVGKVKGREEGGLRVVEVGVEVELERKGKKWSEEVRLGGRVEAVMPGLTVPVCLNWTLKEEAVGWTWRVEQEVVEQVVGMKGLRLEDVEMTAVFARGQRFAGCKMDMKAVLAFQGGKLQLAGAYEKGDFFVESRLDKCTVNDLIDLYTSMTGRKLEATEHRIELQDLLFRIDNTGLRLKGGVTVNDHSSAQAEVQIKRDGIMITGRLQDITIHEVTVKHAELDVFIGRKSKNETSRESGLSITGKVNFHVLELEVAVYTNFTQNKKAEYTIYGEIKGSGMKLNKLAPDVEGTWLDIELRQIAFIVSNSQQPAGNYNTFNYPITRGVQLCAAIDRIEPIDHIARDNVDGLVLRACWSGGKKFQFEAILPTPIGIHLTKTITSGPITVGIVPAKIPELVITAALNVIPPGQKHPLVFTFGLKANLVGAKGFGQMENYWVNPFGISESIKVGPNLALEVGIIYAVLAATGTPSSIGFSGGMAIGDVEAQCAMVISENPADQLLKASLTELSIVDLTKFASTISGHDIPIPPEDLLAFRDVLVYLSTGTSIGMTQYPAGASLHGEMELFGKQTKLSCSVGAITKIDAHFDSFQLGPLALTGTKPGTGPQTVVELGRQKQHILIDGAVQFFDMSASVHGVFDILPTPSVSFELKLSFADALRMTLSAELVGMVDWKNIHGADFMIHAILEQDITTYLISQLKRFLEAVIRLFKNGLDAAHEFIDTIGDGIEETISTVHAAFEAAKEEFEEKQNAVKNALHEFHEDFEEKLKRLQEDIFGVERETEEKVHLATQELQSAKLRYAKEVRSAEITFCEHKRCAERELKQRLSEVRAVKEQAKARVGTIDAQVREAEARVKEAESYSAHCNKAYAAALEDLSNAHFYRKLDLHHRAHQLRHQKEQAAYALDQSRESLRKAKEISTHPTLQDLLSRKAQLKSTLRETRHAHSCTLTRAESALLSRRKEEAATLAYHEAKIEKERLTLQPVLQLKTQELEKLKETQTPVLEKLKQEAELLPRSPEFGKLQEAKQRLRETKMEKLDTAAARKAIATVSTQLDTARKPLKRLDKALTLAEKGASVAKGVHSTIEDVKEGRTEILHIRRVELHGSLRDLIERGIPLKARIVGVIVGKEFDVTIDYGLRDLAGLVEGLWTALWEMVKDVSDGDEDDDDEEVAEGDLKGEKEVKEKWEAIEEKLGMVKA